MVYNVAATRLAELHLIVERRSDIPLYQLGNDPSFLHTIYILLMAQVNGLR